MPLLFTEQLAPQTQLGLWSITESADELHTLVHPSPSLQHTLAQCKSTARQREILATYALLHTLTGNNRTPVTHTPQGKPLYPAHHISISHTRGYAAIILSQSREVAVDIEYTSDRVAAIRRKFLRSDEQVHSNAQLLLHWCAKETAFKYYTPQPLQAADMRLRPFQLQASGIATIENLLTQESLPVHYRITPHYTLTYTY